MDIVKAHYKTVIVGIVTIVIAMVLISLATKETEDEDGTIRKKLWFQD